MSRWRQGPWPDRLVMMLVAVGALALRSTVSYRTAFVDEGINLFEGWRMLHGQTTDALHYHMGWPVLSAVPLGLAGWFGGVEAARGLNVVWGTATVLVVMGLARQVYGPAAGYIAGGLYAAYGPAILVSTLATYDSLSVLLLSVGLYLCLYALSGDRRWPFLAAGLMTALAVLTKYAAAPIAGVLGFAVAIALLWLESAPTGRALPGVRAKGRAWLGKVILLGLPLLLVPAYGWICRGPLADLWVGQVLSKQSAEPGIRWTVLANLARTLGLPLVCGLACLFRYQTRARCFQRRPAFWKHSSRRPTPRPGGRLEALSSLLLLAAGLSMVPYHLLNRDSTTLLKHTCYMLVGMAPLAAGGAVATADALLGSRLNRSRLAVSTGLLGLALIGIVGSSGQLMLPGLRSYWPDTAEAMAYLRSAVRQGDSVLMEQGAVGRYYLVEKGALGHIPQEVVDTWWYQDDEGAGEQAYRRAILAQRFEWVVFDYTVTAQLEEELLRLMEGRYDRHASFPARIHGQYGTIDVFRAAR